MAKNAGSIEQALPINMELTVTAGGVSGDVQAISDLVVYLQTDRNTTTGKATVTIPCKHVQKVSVTAVDNSGNSAVALGDKLYLDAGVINKDSVAGKAFGYALEAVASGETANIQVGFGL
jgi:hypothetical protein